MTGARRPGGRALAAALLAIGLALAPLAAVRAQGAPPGWEGSAFGPSITEGMTVGHNDVPIDGVFRNRVDGLNDDPGIARVTFEIASVEAPPTSTSTTSSGSSSSSSTTGSTTSTTQPDTGIACPLPNIAPIEVDGEDEGATVPFNVLLELPCNGTYRFSATATERAPRFRAPTSHRLTVTFDVAGPAPTPEDLTAASDDAGRRITVLWSELTDPPPDALGFLVERRIGSGDWEEVAQRPLDDPGWVDEALPEEGGQARYRVRSARIGPRDTLVVSEASDEGVATFAKAPTTTTRPGDPPTPTTTAPPATGGTGSTVDPGERFKRLQQDATRDRPRFTTPTTADTGFDETLGYPTLSTIRPVGGDDGELAGDDGLISLDDGSDSRAVVVSVAAALVMGIGALQLRHLTRRALHD